MIDRSFERANDETRARLARMAATLTPAQLAADLGEGWTVTSSLAHVGFWDRWQAVRWEQMLAGSWSAIDDSVIAAEHLANEALHPYWGGIEGENLAALAVEAADTLDALIARAPDALVEQLAGGPSAYLLHRHRHRNDHLDHIERTLVATPSAELPADKSLGAGSTAGASPECTAIPRPHWTTYVRTTHSPRGKYLWVGAGHRISAVASRMIAASIIHPYPGFLSEFNHGTHLDVDSRARTGFGRVCPHPRSNRSPRHHRFAVPERPDQHGPECDRQGYVAAPCWACRPAYRSKQPPPGGCFAVCAIWATG